MIREYGRIPKQAVFVLPEHAGKRVLSVAAARAILADYEDAFPELPPHSQNDVALVIGPMGQVAWYLAIPEVVGKHRRGS